MQNKFLKISLYGLLLTLGLKLNAQTNSVTVNGYSDIILFDKPIAYYRFEETSGSVATNSGSAGGNGAYYTGDEATPGAGGTPSTPKGDPGPRPPDFKGFDAANKSASFGGSATMDWVDTKNQFLQGLPAFSLEYWVRPTNRVADPTTFGTRIGIVGQNDAIEYGFIDANTIQIWTPNGGSLNTAYSFPDNEWHHVATIADGTSLKTYYDGVLKGSSSATTADYGTSTYNVHIGGGGVFDATGNYFTGNIDEVAIFDRAIPAARIAEHYQAGKNGNLVVPFIHDPVASINGFSIDVSDVGPHVADTNTITLSFNGTNVTATSVVKTTNTTTISYNLPNPLPSGLSNIVTMTIKDVGGVLYSNQASFVTPVYGTLATNSVLAAGSVDTTKPGFKIHTYQVNTVQPNSIENAEAILIGAKGPNVVNLTDAGGVDTNGFFTWTNVINFDIDTTAADGHFNQPDYTDSPFPGIPGTPTTGVATENFALEITTALQFPATGFYTMVVNSDDDFRVLSGSNPRDLLASSILGEFNAPGGRGAADTSFRIYVPQAGIYPFRLVYEQGQGGGNLEWFMLSSNNVAVLINDTTNNAIKAYQWEPPTNSTYVRAVTPTPGTTSANPDVIRLELVNGATPVPTNTLQLSLNNTAVQPTLTTTGNVTYLSYTISPLLGPNTVNNAVFSYGTGTNAVTNRWQFTTANFGVLTSSLIVTPDTTKPGFLFRIHQTTEAEPNDNAWAEDQIHGKHGPNIADANAVGTALGPGVIATNNTNLIQFEIPGVINFDVLGSASTAAGDFLPYDQMPGMPGTTASTDNVAAEILTFIDLPVGLITMGVNSDDGFRTSAGPINNPTNIFLGEYNGGRGAADTIFSFTVQQAGVYPFRTLWEQGGGGANVEWFTVNADGTKVLLNGNTNGAYKTYRFATGGGGPGPTNNAPTLSFTQTSNSLTLTFTGKLQETSVLGATNTAWNTLTVTSPYTVTNLNTGTNFFRAINQ